MPDLARYKHKDLKGSKNKKKVDMELEGGPLQNSTCNQFAFTSQPISRTSITLSSKLILKYSV